MRLGWIVWLRKAMAIRWRTFEPHAGLKWTGAWGFDMNAEQQDFFDHLGPVEPILAIDICLVAVAVVGICLNGLLLFIACLRRTRRWAIDAILIVAIGLFDAVVCLSLIASFGARSWLGAQVWDAHGVWCKLTAICFSGATVVTLGFSGLLAVVRYLALVRAVRINTRLWLATTSVVMLVLIGFTVERGINGMLFVLPAGFYCTPQYYGSDWATISFGLLNAFVFFPAVAAIPFCYVKISLRYTRIIQTMYDIDHLDIVKGLRKNTTCLVGILGGYTLCILPEVLHIVLSMAFKIKRTALSDGIVMLLMSYLSIINPLFALLLHDESRLEFLGMLGIVKRHQIPF